MVVFQPQNAADRAKRNCQEFGELWCEDILMNKYRFGWKDIVHGQIEIDADSGVEAERLFRDMKIEERLQLSVTGADKDTLEIKFVDIGFGDIQTSEEWEDTYKHIS